MLWCSISWQLYTLDRRPIRIPHERSDVVGADAFNGGNDSIGYQQTVEAAIEKHCRGIPRSTGPGGRHLTLPLIPPLVVVAAALSPNSYSYRSPTINATSPPKCVVTYTYRSYQVTRCKSMNIQQISKNNYNQS